MSQLQQQKHLVLSAKWLFLAYLPGLSDSLCSQIRKINPEEDVCYCYVVLLPEVFLL